MAPIVANTGANSWNTNAAWVGGVQPTAADDVTIPATAVVTIPAATTALARSVSVSASGTLAFAATSSVLTIGDGSGGALTVNGTATVTLTGVGTINFVSTSNNGGTGWGVTSGGKTLPNLTFNGAGGKWVLQDALTASAVTLSSGTLDTNGKTVSAASLVLSGSTARTLTTGASSITLTLAGTALNASNATSLTLTTMAATTITISGAGATMSSSNGGGSALTWGVVSFTGSGTATLTSLTGTTFGSLNRTGTAAKTDILALSSDLTVNTSLALAGNSATNRALVQSSVVGTARTVTLSGTATCRTAGSQNVDLMDITLAGGAANERDLSAITGLVGDCGGNSGITFTVSATQTHTTSAGGSWSDVTKWTSRVPLPQDDIVVNASTTGTLTADMPRLGRSIDFTGFAGTFTYGTNVSIFGSLTLATGMAYSGGVNVTFAGRGSYTLTSSGKSSTSNFTLNAPGGTYTQADAFTLGGSALLVVTNGTWTTSDLSVTTPFFQSTTGTHTINGGASTFTIASTGNAWNVSGGTVNMSTATVTFTNVTSTARTFIGGANTYGTVNNGAGQAELTISNGNGTTTITNLTGGPMRWTTVTAAGTTNITNLLGASGARNGYVHMPGASGNTMSAPDSAALSITGDLTILVRVALDDWTPASNQALLCKDQSAGARSYALIVDTAGKPNLFVSQTVNASVFAVVVASVATGFTDGTTQWLLACFRASDSRVQFFTAPGSIVNPAASDFTQLGTNGTATGVSSISDSTAIVEIGTEFGGTLALAAGNFYRAQIYNGVFSTAAFGGTVQFDADIASKAVGVDSFVEGSANAATVTIAGVLAQIGDGRARLDTSGAAATIATGAGATIAFAQLIGITATPSKAVYALDSVDGGTNSGVVFSPPDELPQGMRRIRQVPMNGSSRAVVGAGRW